MICDPEKSNVGAFTPFQAIVHFLLRDEVRQYSGHVKVSSEDIVRSKS